MTEAARQIKLFFFIISIFIGLGITLTVYVMYFDIISEEGMITAAYPQAFFIVTGIAGLCMKNNPRALQKALICGGVSVLAVLFFFASVFPSL